MKRVLFVCTGNICRSPLAEAIFRHKVKLAGSDGQWIADSAGTHNYHAGERPDPRSLKVAQMNGIQTEGIRAKQIKRSDFEEFDLILAMDQGHVQWLQNICPPEYLSKIHLFMAYAGEGEVDVPDPYYGDFSEFEDVYAMCDAALNKMIASLLVLN